MRHKIIFPIKFYVESCDFDIKIKLHPDNAAALIYEEQSKILKLTVVFSSITERLTSKKRHGIL